jgi:hypothetical protein
VTTVIDVSIDPEENVFPMVPAGMGLTDIILEAGSAEKASPMNPESREKKEIIVEVRR